MQAGAKGEDVKYVQALLNIHQTGVFDERTITAVNTFKEKYGLGNTGVWKGAVGDQTLDAMKNAAFALPIPSAAEYAQSNGIWVNSDDSKYLNWGKNGDGLISASIGISEEITGKGQAITSDWEYKYYLANVSPAMEGIAEGQFGNLSRTMDPKRYSGSDWLVYQDALLGGQGLAGSIISIVDIMAYSRKIKSTNTNVENKTAPTVSKNRQPATVEELIEMMNKRKDVSASFAEGDALEYLKAMKAEASHTMMEKGVSDIIFRKDLTTRRTVFHEWLHRYLQMKNNGAYRPNEDLIIEKFLERHKGVLKIE